MSTGEPAGEGGGGGGGGGGESTPGGDHSAGTPVGVTGIQSGAQTGAQHPPPSPLSGCYLLVVLPEPHTAQHKDLIVNRLAKGFLSWDKDSCHVDLEKELQALVAQAPEGEEARNGERLIQYATENLVTEVLIHPQTNTLLQCIRNLLASFTKHRHIIHAGYTFSGNGSWILQDGTFSLADFLDAFSEHEVQRVLRAYENSVTVDIHCTGVGDWTTSRLSKEPCTRSCRVRVNPDDVLTAGVPAISSFTNYIAQYLVAQTLDQLMEPSDVVGNIRFSHPTLYVFPGGQGDAALFGINGFNMLVDGGFARKACFWDFARHLDRLDAVLLTRVNNSNIGGMSSVLRKKQEMHVYPQIGHFFCNLVERRQANSPDGDKDVDPLILNLTDLGQEMMVNLRHINLRAHPCYRDLDPINLYHKVGHGTLDMYVLSPSKDTREVREFLTKWQASDSKLFAGSHKKDSNNLTFPIQNLVSICALLVWQPANPEDTITRILFPGSTPQNKIFEGLERLKHLEFMKHPVCSAKSLSPSTSLAALKEKSYKQKTAIIEKSGDKEKDTDKVKDKDIKRVSDYRKEKKETLEPKTVKGVEDSIPKPAVPSAPIIPTKQPAKVDVKAKKVVENKKIERETKTESKKMEKEFKEVKRDVIIKREPVKAEKQEVETKKTDVVKTETEKTVVTKESKTKPEPKKKEIKEARTVVKSKVETSAKTGPKPTAEKKLKPSIDKKDVKSSPTTPKKIVNGTASRIEISKTTSTKTTTKTTSRTVSAMPAKSAKDANNRKVVESKNIALSSAPATAKAPSVTAKPKSTDRKLISRRPKTGSPSKPRLPGSPAKSTRSTPTASVKSEKDGVIRRPKSEKGTTDSSAVSTPSAVEVENVVKIADKSLAEKSDDISIDSIESKVLADLKEEREVVEEIEAVLSKAERNEIARKEDQLEGDDEITAEATDKKEEDVTEEDVTAEIEDAPKKVGSRKESQEFTEEDEYLIVEKEEIYTEDSALSGEGEQKHLLDEVESEKAKKYEVSKDLDITEEEAKEKDETEEKEKDERPEKKIQFHEEEKNDFKEQLEEEVKDIIASATEMVQKTDERDDSGKKDSEDITKEPSSVSPDKFDSSEKKTTDTDLKPEADQKETLPEKLEESQDRISTLESGATTTAPTLPEDERIPLDEIKEDVDEKYVKEEVKEKEVQPVKEKLQEIPAPVPTPTMKTFVIREVVPAAQRDIVKTPDEVADLPVHEEVDPKLYDMDDFDKVKEDKVPQTPEAKEPPTPPVKEQKGMFSFFGKVADKFEKGMDKLTGKSKKDAEKEPEDKSSKSSSPKETKPQEKSDLGDIDMGKVFAKVGKIDTHDAFEKAMPQAHPDIKVAAIKETAAFLQQEIRETKIDTVHSFEPVISDLKHVEDSLETKKLDEKEIVEDVAPELEKTSDLKPTKEEILNQELVEDTKEVEALLEEASKKFVTVKDSLRDSLESLEDKIADEIIEDIQPKDQVQSTLVGAAERLEEFRPQYDETADSKEPDKVKFEIPKDSEDAEDDSEEYAGPVRDLKEAVRDVGEVLAGTAGIVIDDKPKDVIEIVKKVAEVLKEDNFLLEKVLFDKTTEKDDKPEDTTDARPIIEEMIMPKKVGVTEELPPQEEIEEMLEGGVARPLATYERAGDVEVSEEPCVKIVKDPKPEVRAEPVEKAATRSDIVDFCTGMSPEKKLPSPKVPSPKDYEGKVDVMKAGIEEVCTKKELKREETEEDEDQFEDEPERLEQPEILFQQKLSPAQAELVMVTPDSAPTSPKFTTDKVYDKELEEAVRGVDKAPGVPKEIEEFISSKADVYDIIDEVIRTGKKITIEIIEYIVIVKKVSREHVIYIIEEIIINKGISPESVIENVDILKSQESTSEPIISSVKRIEIEEYIVSEYIMKGRRITVQTIEEIAIKKVVPKRIVIEIIEEIIVKRKISRESVYEIVEEEFIRQVKPIYDEIARQLHHKSLDHENEPEEKSDHKLSPEPVIAGIIPAEVQKTSPKDDQPKSPEGIQKQQAPEPSKEKDAPIFDEKDLDEGKLIDDFVNISSKDAVLNFLHEERRLSHEEYVPEKKDSPTISKPGSKTPTTDDGVKDSGDDFEAVEQEYKVHDVPKTAATTFHDLKDKDDVLEAVEDDLDDVVEAAEKFVEETKEKPESLKETLIPDDKVPKDDSAPVEPKAQLVPEVKDHEIQPVKGKPDDASDGADDDSVSNVTSVIATEKYLDEDKEKTTSDLPKPSKDPEEIADDIIDAIQDTVQDLPSVIDEIKHDVQKSDKPDPKTETIDRPEKTITDKPDVDFKVAKEEPAHEEETDVKAKSPFDDVKDSIKATVTEVTHVIHDVKHPAAKTDDHEPKTNGFVEHVEKDVGVTFEEKEHVTEAKSPKEKLIVEEKETVLPEIAKGKVDKEKEGVKEVIPTPDAVAPVTEKTDKPDSATQRTDEKASEPAKESPKEIAESPDALKHVVHDASEKIEEFKGEDIVPDVTDTKILDTSEIADLKQPETKSDEKKPDTEIKEVPKETADVSPEHAGDPKIVDSSCFNIGQPETPQAPSKEVPDILDELEDTLTKPGHVDAEIDSISTEPDHSVRKKRSLLEDPVEPEIAEPEEVDLEPKEVAKTPVASVLAVEEKEKSKLDDLEPATKAPSAKTPDELIKADDDDEDDKDTGTVRRMVVTASSEDGGHEVELCPTGSITFGKSVTPDDSLRDISTKSTPDKDSLLMEKDSLYSGKSTPEKDSISEKSISELKDDRVTPEDSLEKSIHGHVPVTDEGRRKSQVDEPKGIKPVTSDVQDQKTPLPAHEATEKPTEKVPEKLEQESPKKPTEEVPEKPAESIPQKPADKITDKPTEKVPEKLEETIPEKVTDKVTDKPSEKVPEKPEEIIPEKVTDKVADKPSEKLSEQLAEKLVEKPTEIPGLKSPEPAESTEISPAETIFDKSPTKKLPSDEPDHSPSDDKHEDKTETPSIPVGIVETEADVSRKSSIASVKLEDAKILDDELHKDKSPSPIEKSSVVSEKLDEKDSPAEVQTDKTTSPISEPTADKPKSPSITPEDLKESPEDRDKKDKSPSPTVEDHAQKPKEHEEHIPSEHLEKDKSPTIDKETVSPKSLDVSPEQDKEKEIPSEKLPKEKSPSPTVDVGTDKPRTPSIGSEKLDEKEVPEDKLHKDKSPSPTTDEKIDRSRTPSIACEKPDEKHVLEDETPKEKSPLPDAVTPADKSQASSIASEKPDLKDVAESAALKDKSPSPSAEEIPDKSRTPSVISEKPDDKEIPEIHEQKDKSPSPTADEIPDKSRTPSIVPEKQTEQVVLDDKVQKDKSPSPSADKVTDKSPRPSITSEKLDQTDISESHEQKDKSPSPVADKTPEKSRAPSITPEKPAELDVLHDKDRSPSPTTDKLSEKPSITSEKPDEKGIPESHEHKEKSPSPVADKTPDRSRAPSITLEKPAEQDVLDDKVPKDKSLSPTTDKSRTPSISSEIPDEKDVLESHEQKDKSPSPVAEDRSRTSSIASEKPIEHITPDDKLHKERSPSPTVDEAADRSRASSIISDKPDTKDLPETISEKDKSPSPTTDKVLDKSRSPSIDAGKPAEQVAHDEKVHKDKSPSPSTDKSRSPSIISEKPDEKDVPETHEQKDKSPSPTIEDKPDRSRTSSIASDKPAEQIIPGDKVHKEKSPSPTTDDATDDVCRKPSIAAEKPIEQIALDDKVRKDRSPSLSTDEVPDKSRSPSIISEKPDEKDVPESHAPKDKSPSPMAEDRSRTSSIASEKPIEPILPGEKVDKEKSPSPTKDEVTDRSRASSIASDKPDAKDIPEHVEEKDKSPSPTIDDKPDKSRAPSITPEKPTEQVVLDDKVHGDKLPSPSTDKVTDKSRSPSIASEKPDEKDVLESQDQKDKSPSPTTEDRSRASSIASEKPVEHITPDGKVHKEKSPSPTEDRSRASSIASEKPVEHITPDGKVHKEKSPSPTEDKVTDRSRASSIASDKLDAKDIPESITEKDKSPSPTDDEKLDKSRSPSIIAGKPVEHLVPDEKVLKDKSPSPTLDKPSDKSRTPSTTSETPDVKDIPESTTEKDVTPDKLDKSPTPSIVSEKPDLEDVPDSIAQKDKSPSPIDDKKPGASPRVSITAEQPTAQVTADDKVAKDKSPSPAADEIPDKSRTPSIAPEEETAKVIPDDKEHKERSPSPTADKATEELRKLSITPGKPDDKDTADDKAHKEKSPSPTGDADKSREPSITPGEVDEKDVSHETIHKERSPSPPADKETVTSRKPSIAKEEVHDKDIPDDKKPKERSPSPITDAVTEETRRPSITHEKLDDKHTADDKVHKDKSPSPIDDETTVESRKPSIVPEKSDEKDVPETKVEKDKSPSPTTDDKTEHHSRTPSICSEKPDDKDIPDDKSHKDKSPSPTADKVTDKSRSPSIASEKPDEKDVSESKVQKDKSPSPTVEEKPEHHSRTPSISSEKLAADDIPEALRICVYPDYKLPEDRSSSPTVDKAIDEPGLTSAKPDEKDVPETKLQKDKSPSPTPSDKTDHPSRTSSITSVKDEVVAQVPKDKSPSPTVDKETDKSRASSITSEKPDEKDVSEIKPQKDKSPSPTGDKITDEPGHKVLDGEIPKDRSPSPTTDKVIDRSRTPSIASGKLDAVVLPADKLPKDQSPSSPEDDKKTKPEEVPLSDKPGEKSRSPSIASEKLDDKDIPSHEHPKEKSPSPTTDKVIDQSKIPSVPDHKPQEEHLPKEPSAVDVKSDHKPEVSEVTPKKLDVTGTHDDKADKERSPSPSSDVSDGIRSPSIPSEKSEVDVKLDDKKPDQQGQKDRSPSPSTLEVADKSRSPSVASDVGDVMEVPQKLKSPSVPDDKPEQGDVEDSHKPDDKIQVPEKSKSPLPSPSHDQLDDTPKKELLDSSTLPSSIKDEPQVTDKSKHDDEKLHITEDDKPEDLSRPSSVISGKSEDSVPADQKKDDSPKSPSPLSEKPEQHSDTAAPGDKPQTLDVKGTDLVHEPESPNLVCEKKTDKIEAKSPSPSTDVLPDKSRSASIASEKSKSPGLEDDKPDDLIRPSSRASITSEHKDPADGQKSPAVKDEIASEKEAHKSPVDESTPEEPKSPGEKETADSKSPRDRSPSYDRTPKDRSRSHSLFDSGDRTPLGRSRAASLFDDKLDDKIALLDLDALRPSISEEVEEDKSTRKDDDSKLGSKSPSVADLDSPKSLKAVDVKDSDLPAGKRLEIEQYIIEEFISKKRRITLEIIEEIVIKKSVSRYIVIQIIEEIIIKRNIPRESVVDFPESDQPQDEVTEVENKHAVPKTPEIHDSKSPEPATVVKDVKPQESPLGSKRPSIVSDSDHVHEIPDDKKPRETISDEISDPKDSTTPSSVDDHSEEPEPHVIKKRSVLEEKSPEEKLPEPTEKQTEPETAITHKDESPEPEGVGSKRPSVVDDKHSQPEPAEAKPVTSASPKSPEAETLKRPSVSEVKIPELDQPKVTVEDTKKPTVVDDLKKPEDQTKPHATVIPTVVAKTEDGADIHSKAFEEESFTITESKRTEIEEYIVEEYIVKGKRITREIIEEIVIKKSVPRYIILEIIEEIIVKRKISRVLVIDFVEDEATDKEDHEPTDQSTASSISDKDDVKLRKFSEDKFDVTTGKSTPEISSAKDQTIDFSGKSTPDLKSSLLSEKYSDKSGYSTPDMKQFDERSGKSTPDYRTEYESQFHKAFVGGMTEMRTTHITTLSGKSTPDFGPGRDDTPEPKSESQLKPDQLPADKSDHPTDVPAHESEALPPKDKAADSVLPPKGQSDPHHEESPEKPTESKPSITESTFATTISAVTKATSELVSKISESTASSISTVTSKIITTQPEPEIITDKSGPEDSKPSSTVKTSVVESEPEIITKVIKREVETHEPSETEVITRTIRHVTEIEEGEPEIITKVIRREVFESEDESHEPSEVEVITKTIRHVTEVEESEPEIITKVIRREVEAEDETTPSSTTTTKSRTIEVESEPEIITKVIKREIETHEPSETEIITRTVRYVTEVEEGEPEVITKVIRREVVDSADDTTSTKTFTTVKTSEDESEPSETEVITRTIRHVTEVEESEPEIITKVIKREIIVPDDEEVHITTKTTKVIEEDGTDQVPETSETVTKTVKSSEAQPDVVKRIISREGTPEVTETVTTRTTKTIVAEASPSTETVTKTTTTTITSDIEKPELITRIISREGTPEISETIKRTTKTISSDAGPEYVTRIISREGTPEILKSSEVKRIVTTVTTVTGPDGESVTTKDVKESSDKLDGEDLLEKLIDSSSSEKIAKSTPDVKTSEERFVSETPDGLITEEIIKRTVTTVTSSSGTSTPDVKTFIDSEKSTPDHKDDEKTEIPAKEKTDKPTSEPKVIPEKSTTEIPSSSLVKGIISEDKSFSGKSSPDISLPKDVVSSGSTGKSTPDIPVSPLIRDSASIQGRILSGRSTPDRKSDGRSRTATPEGFRSGEVIRTIITTTRTMSDDGEIITVTKEVTESTDEQGQTVVLEEKTDVKRDDKLPSKDAAETAISSVIGGIKASELKRGSSPGSDVMSDRDVGPISPRSDISSGHSRAATHVWGSSEERHTYSDDEPPSSPLSATSQFGYSPQPPRYELPFDKDSHKHGDAMTGSFYGELPTEPATTSTTKSGHTSGTTSSKNSEPIPIQGEHSMKRFVVEKEFESGYEFKMESKKYVDDGDLDFDRAMMEHREKRGEDLVSHHYSNGASSAVYTNGNARETVVTKTTVEKKTGEVKKGDPMAASFSAEKEAEEAGKSGKDPLEGWGKPLFLPSPKPPRKFNLQRPVASTSSEELNPESLNFDVINNWGEPLRLPSPAPAPAPTNEVSNKGAPGTPKKERKQPKKVVSENNKNKKRSESPSKNDKKTKDSKNKVQPVYMDLTYVPHHGNSYYSSLEFFKRIRARYYVFSGTEPSREVYDALLEAKKTWEDKNLEVTMIPTYDTDTLGYWVADNEEALAANHIDLSPSASRCTINLQDHETSCSAYRLEF